MIVGEIQAQFPTYRNRQKCKDNGEYEFSRDKFESCKGVLILFLRKLRTINHSCYRAIAHAHNRHIDGNHKLIRYMYVPDSPFGIHKTTVICIHAASQFVTDACMFMYLHVAIYWHGFPLALCVRVVELQYAWVQQRAYGKQTTLSGG